MFDLLQRRWPARGSCIWERRRDLTSATSRWSAWTSRWCPSVFPSVQWPSWTTTTVWVTACGTLDTRLFIHHSVREDATRSQYQISNLYTSHFVNEIAGYQYKIRLFTPTKKPHEIIVNSLGVARINLREGGGYQGACGIGIPLSMRKPPRKLFRNL